MNNAAQESLKTIKIFYFTCSMKKVYTYIKQYYEELDKRILITVSLLTAMLVFINYYWGLDAAIRQNNVFTIKLVCWYGVFLLAFSLPYLITRIYKPAAYFHTAGFLSLLFIAPLFFAIKISLSFKFNFANDPNQNYYWNQVVYWPLLLLIITIFLFLTWYFYDEKKTFYGFTGKHMDWKPYLLMLLMMVPLVAVASVQEDFQLVYPKLDTVTAGINGERPGLWQKILFELSYGTDFISIELFFRGFLILAFVKWAGKDAILPMACFYCVIHFGKPLGECISSYFGAILLGIIVYNTRSVLGGLLVHLGIAWLMELGGYIGNAF